MGDAQYHWPNADCYCPMHLRQQISTLRREKADAEKSIRELVKTFNATSERYGFPERLPAGLPTPPPDASEIGALAYEITDRGFTVRTYYTDGPDAHVEITRDGRPFKTFDYPSYRIWNIAAHFAGMIDAWYADAIRDPANG